ncbi:MAG: queuosine 5'-phosphate N-glycosylase/hydrolase [Deltaproteobacteria bacterium]
MLEVRVTARRVAEKSRHVRINQEALEDFSRELVLRIAPAPEWVEEHHFRGNEQETIAYLLAVDTVNFCFWPPSGEEKGEIFHEGNSYSGYYGLSVSLKKAIESGIPLTNAAFLASLRIEQLEEVLEGTGVLQLVDERLRNLQETGRVLLEKYGGRASGLVSAARGSAIRLVELLGRDFPSFQDRARYQGEEIFFYKRAQLFAADIHSALGGKGLGSFRDIKELTAFADYKLPQVLRHVGVLEYSEGLAGKVDRRICLDPGSEEEVEIRANTIWAVELIRPEMNRLGKAVTASQIDWLLWNLGQDDVFRTMPYHRTVTTFY